MTLVRRDVAKTLFTAC